jgi:hypothetical protein
MSLQSVAWLLVTMGILPSGRSMRVDNGRSVVGTEWWGNDVSDQRDEDACSKIIGAGARQSKNYPQCKCKDDYDTVYCDSTVVAERKFNATEVLKACHAPICFHKRPDALDTEQCASKIIGATARSSVKYPFCKCKAYSDKVFCGSKRVGGRKFDAGTSSGIAGCTETLKCQKETARNAEPKSCSLFSGATTRSTEAYPSCKCLSYEHRLFCSGKEILERKFNATAALGACEEPYCDLCEGCEKSSAAMRVVLQALQPFVEPYLAPLNMTWEDVAPLLDELDSAEEVAYAIQHPEAFAADTCKKIATAKLKPVVEPWLTQQGMTWAEFEPMLRKVDTFDELVKAIQQPKAFTESLVNDSGELSHKFLVGKLKTMWIDALNQAGLPWADVQKVLESLESIDELKQMIQNPEQFLKDLKADPLEFFAGLAGRVLDRNAADLVLKQILLERLQPIIEPRLAGTGLTWSDVAPLLKTFETVEHLKQALANPTVFMEEFNKGATELARQVVMKKLETVLTPIMENHGISWEHAEFALQQINNVDEMRRISTELDALIADPLTFFTDMALRLSDTGSLDELLKKLLIDKMRPAIEPQLEGTGLVWSDVEPILAKVDTVAELRVALNDPNAFMDELKGGANDLARSFALKQLGPVMDDALGDIGLLWANVEPVMGLVVDPAKLREIAQNPEVFLKKLREEPLAFFTDLVGNANRTEASIALIKELLIKDLRLAIETKLSEAGLPWSDVESLLINRNTEEQLREALADPSAFLQELLQGSSNQALEIALKILRRKWTPILQAEGLTWAEVQSMLNTSHSAAKVRELIEMTEEFRRDPRGFLDRLKPTEVPSSPAPSTPTVPPPTEVPSSLAHSSTPTVPSTPTRRIPPSATPTASITQVPTLKPTVTPPTAAPPTAAPPTAAPPTAATGATPTAAPTGKAQAKATVNTVCLFVLMAVYAFTRAS